MKIFYAPLNSTLIEEHAFLDTRIPDRMTASQDHILYTMTQKERINIA